MIPKSHWLCEEESRVAGVTAPRACHQSRPAAGCWPLITCCAPAADSWAAAVLQGLRSAECWAEVPHLTSLPAGASREWGWAQARQGEQDMRWLGSRCTRGASQKGKSTRGNLLPHLVGIFLPILHVQSQPWSACSHPYLSLGHTLPALAPVPLTAKPPAGSCSASLILAASWLCIRLAFLGNAG